MVDDIAALKPTVFCAVPRVLDRIYSGINSKCRMLTRECLADQLFCIIPEWV